MKKLLLLVSSLVLLNVSFADLTVKDINDAYLKEYSLEKDINKRIEISKEALKKYPPLHSATLNLLTDYSMLKESDKLDEVYDFHHRFLDENSQMDFYREVSERFSDIKDFLRAKVVAEELENVNPAIYTYLLARIEYNKGEYSKALSLAEDALKMTNMDNVYAERLIYMINVAKKDKKGINKALEDIYSRRPYGQHLEYVLREAKKNNISKLVNKIEKEKR